MQRILKTREVLTNLDKMSSDIRERIIEHASICFTQNGIRSITMDDIAEDLCISKRTIYEQFKDKKDLVNECLVYLEKKKRINDEFIYRNSNDTIDFLLKIFIKSLEDMKKISPLFLSDLHKQFPEIEERRKEKRKENIKHLTQIFEKGKEEGLICEQFDASELSFLLDHEIEMLIGENQFDLLPKEKFISIYKTMFLIFLRGIVTPLGIIKIDKLISEGI